MYINNKTDSDLMIQLSQLLTGFPCPLRPHFPGLSVTEQSRNPRSDTRFLRWVTLIFVFVVVVLVIFIDVQHIYK